MKQLFKITLLLVSGLAFTSCEDVVQIKLDEGSKLYVIDAFVNNLRTPQIIKVSTNDSYFSNRVAPPVTNANVVLVDLTENISYNFTYNASSGNYVFNLASGDTISKINHRYMLNVTINGVVYSSLTTQKRTAKIDSIGTIYNEEGGPFGGTKDTYNCFLYAKDKADSEADYYRILTYRNDTLFNEPSDINLAIDGTNGAVTNSPLDSTVFTAPIIFLGFETYAKNDLCKVEIHSISKETYFFYVQALNQINNGGLFATTPENVKTNISTPSGAPIKAIGWFNMASVDSKTRLVN